MSQTPKSKCENPTCEKIGDKNCAKCHAVKYCSAACQKEHWGVHKTACKVLAKNPTRPLPLSPESPQSPTSPASPTSPVPSSTPKPTSSVGVVKPQQLPSTQIPIDPAVVERLKYCKQQTMLAFQAQNFQASIGFAQDCMEVTKQFPEHVQWMEDIQILLNMSSAYLQMNQIDKAEPTSAICVQTAEKLVNKFPTTPQALEQLSLALTNRVFILLTVNRLADAEPIALRAFNIAESIFPPNDPRHFRSLRALAVVRAKQDNVKEAQKYFQKAYLISQKAHGPCHPETQQAVDELLQILMRQREQPQSQENSSTGNKSENPSLRLAAEFAKKNFDSLTEREPNPEHPIIGESAAKYATILAMDGKHLEAEPLMKKALAVREKVHGPRSQAVAVTLMALANLRDAMGDLSEATELLLIRALDIFKEQGLTQSNENVVQCLGFVHRLRSRRQGRGIGVGGNTGTAAVSATAGCAEEEDGLTYEVTAESHAHSADRRVSIPPSYGGGSPLSSSAANIMSSFAPVTSFQPNDGNGRMRQAGFYYESKEFAKAEVLLREAHNIFLREGGPNSEEAKAASGNLEIVKRMVIEQLWFTVVQEELVKHNIHINNPNIGPHRGGAATPPSVADDEQQETPVPVGAAGGGGSSVPTAPATPPSGNNKASDAGSSSEELIFQEPEQKSGSCVVC